MALFPDFELTASAAGIIEAVTCSLSGERPSVPIAPRLRPAPNPFSAATLAPLELPQALPPHVEWCMDSDVVNTPKAPRMCPSQDPVFGEPLAELLLPEARTSDEEVLPSFEQFCEFDLDSCSESDDSLGDLDGEAWYFSRLRGISNASTALDESEHEAMHELNPKSVKLDDIASGTHHHTRVETLLGY